MTAITHALISFMLLFQNSDAVVAGTAIFALVVMMLAYHSKRGRQYQKAETTGNMAFTYRWYDHMGKPQWSFTASWATTITTVGAVLSTVLAVALPEQIEQFSKSGVLALNLFFGLLALVAPLLYSAIGVHVRAKDQDQELIEYQGFVWMFFLTCWLTLWAVFGQLVTVTSTITTLVASPGLLQPVFMLAVIVAILGVSSYAIVTIPWTIQDQLGPVATAQLMRQPSQHTQGVEIPLSSSQKELPASHSKQPDAQTQPTETRPQEQATQKTDTQLYNQSVQPAKGRWNLL